jgi:hypothetical protein
VSCRHQQPQTARVRNSGAIHTPEPFTLCSAHTGQVTDVTPILECRPGQRVEQTERETSSGKRAGCGRRSPPQKYSAGHRSQTCIHGTGTTAAPCPCHTPWLVRLYALCFCTARGQSAVLQCKRPTRLGHRNSGFLPILQHGLHMCTCGDSAA